MKLIFAKGGVMMTDKDSAVIELVQRGMRLGVAPDMLSISLVRDPFDLFIANRLDRCETCNEFKMVNFFGDCDDCRNKKP